MGNISAYRCVLSDHDHEVYPLVFCLDDLCCACIMSNILLRN